MGNIRFKTLAQVYPHKWGNNDFNLKKILILIVELSIVILEKNNSSNVNIIIRTIINLKFINLSIIYISSRFRPLLKNPQPY